MMPGTLGTLWGVLFVYLMRGLGHYVQGLFTLALIVAAVILSGLHAKAAGKDDPQEVVIDEAAGFLVTFFLAPFSVLSLILAFLLFRFFDILKPYPIKAVERGVKGGAGIVLDDVLAGIFANVSLGVILWVIEWARAV